MHRHPQDINPGKPGCQFPVIEDPDHLPELILRPVGVVHATYTNHFATPRQPGTAPAADAIIVVRRGMQNALRDLVGFDYAWILFWFCYSRGGPTTVAPPRDGTPRGVFATRAPHRPNPVGLSCVRVLNVVGRKLFIRDHDLLHGTPVLDIKPYLPYCDAHPEAQAGWVDAMEERGETGPDHRWR